MRFVGMLRRRFTGEIFTLSEVKVRMDVNTRALANPHSPFTKNAQKAAAIHQSIITPPFVIQSIKISIHERRRKCNRIVM
jgi:hypothetical protein